MEDQKQDNAQAPAIDATISVAAEMRIRHDDQMPPPIVARAGSYYRNARYVLAILFLGFGAWCIRDGFFVWPRENAQAIQRGQNPKHPGLDIPWNRALGILMPLLSAGILARALYKSRGAIRLDGQTLSAPGHPPVPLACITRIDKRRWDRKGIALLDYQLPTGQTGCITLDDFVYQRKPVDDIFDTIESFALGRTIE